MRAMVLDEPGRPLRAAELPEPIAGPGELLVRVAACAVCRTDLHVVDGELPRRKLPLVVGHQIVGDVVGEGRRVGIPWLGWTDGDCWFCRAGLENLCEREELYGYAPHPGAYAEYAAVPPIATKNLIPLPPELPSDLATVADPFACALNGAEMLDARYGDTVTIIGAGPIGCWQSVLARDRGAGRVYLTEVSKERLEIALEAVGRFVDDAWVTGEDNGVEELLSRTGGAGADRVIVAAPSKQAQQAALVMAAKRARIVYFAGLPKADPVSPLDMNQLHYKELTILGSYGCTPRQYRLTMDYLNRRRDDLGRIVTHRFPLDRIAEAFATIRSGTGLKMVIEPGAPT